MNTYNDSFSVECDSIALIGGKSCDAADILDEDPSSKNLSANDASNSDGNPEKNRTSTGLTSDDDTMEAHVHFNDEQQVETNLDEVYQIDSRKNTRGTYMGSSRYFGIDADQIDIDEDEEAQDATFFERIIQEDDHFYGDNNAASISSVSSKALSSFRAQSSYSSRRIRRRSITIGDFHPSSNRSQQTVKSDHYADHVENSQEAAECEEEIWKTIDTLMNKLPDSHFLLMLLHAYLNPIRILFLVIFIINAAIFATALAGDHVNKRSEYYKSNALSVALYNVVVSIALRNEVVLTILHETGLFIGHHLPLFLKGLLITLLHNLGGIHAGCGIMALLWISYACYEIYESNDFRYLKYVVYITTVLIGLSIFGAWPIFRDRFHNQFEWSHRFFGWSSLGFLWIIVFLTYYYRREANAVTGEKGSYYLDYETMFSEANIYLVIFITFLVALPWMMMRRVAVRCVFPSSKVALLYFDGYVPQGRFAKVSSAPLLEWHTFAISSDPGSKEHYLIVGAVGDWTQNLHKDPPTHLYHRSFHVTGIPRYIGMYKRVLLFCTGAGIAVPISIMMQNLYPDSEGCCYRLLWIAGKVEATYGKELAEKVMSSGRVILYDTDKRPRPDVVKLTLAIARKFKSEAVLITSNPPVTKALVIGCNIRGMVAFGPTFDS